MDNLIIVIAIIADLCWVVSKEADEAPTIDNAKVKRYLYPKDEQKRK